VAVRAQSLPLSLEQELQHHLLLDLRAPLDAHVPQRGRLAIAKRRYPLPPRLALGAPQHREQRRLLDPGLFVAEAGQGLQQIRASARQQAVGCAQQQRLLEAPHRLGVHHVERESRWA
jgi:hypothetical protein